MQDQCMICDSPLGADSKAAGYPFCHGCRKCSKCGQDLTSTECKWCIKEFKSLEKRINGVGNTFEESELDYKGMEVIHPLCVERKDDPFITIRASEYDRLNQVRLAFCIDNSITSTIDIENARLAAIKLFGTLTLEEKQVQQDKITKVLVTLQLLSQQDPKHRKSMIQERDKQIMQEQARVRDSKHTKVKEREETKPKLVEISLEEFKTKWQYADQNEASKQYTLYKNTIKTLHQTLGMEKAIQFAEEGQQKGLERRLKQA